METSNHSIKAKAQKIKAIIVDVDGVLTDGKIIYDNQANEFKNFNVKDGFIVAPLLNEGFILGVITGRNSQVVKRRCQELKFTFHYHGVKNKQEQYQKVKEKYELEDEEIAYIGDDLPDLTILSLCGLGVCPSDAVKAIKPYVDFVAEAKGGEGVLREIGELILEEQGMMQDLVNQYLP